jgi:S-adenosylmethionine:tRNA ribosyltransferase-isomerase
MKNSLKTSDFNFDLPEDLIAQYPLPNRTESRLLVLQKASPAIPDIEHKKFCDLIDYLTPNDLLVFNNSKVMKARLFGRKVTGAKIELLIERIFNPQEFLAHIKANKSLKPGTQILLETPHTSENIFLEVEGQTDGLFHVSLKGPKTIWEIMEEKGHIPLPLYITREDQASDVSRYQTVYAKTLGSVAAPTAGLHFDEKFLQKISDKGIQFAEVTLHVGAGTFKPVKTENLDEHKMHSELIEISPETCEKINKTKARGGKIIAVGTTTVRALESAAAAQLDAQGEFKKLQPYFGETSIFITPPYHFAIVDTLITNFHLPKSTLLMLVSAFSSREKILKAYETAIQEKYRFFSYGDAMLII